MTPAQDTSEPRYVLLKPHLLRELMERTGSGHSISGRRLAREVGVPHGTIDHLLNGNIRTQPYPVALAICTKLGVDLLVLWTPEGRAVPVQDTGEVSPRSAVPA